MTHGCLAARREPLHASSRPLHGDYRGGHGRRNIVFDGNADGDTVGNVVDVAPGP